MSPLHVAAAATLLVMQIACTQAGEHPMGVDDRRGMSPACVAGAGPPCPSGETPSSGPKPAVPPVPESPLKIDCQRLPTQVERDTCTNRKESTG